MTRLEALGEAGSLDLRIPFTDLHLLDALPAPVWLMGQSGRLSYVNARFLESVALTAEELLNAGLEPLIHPQDVALWRSAWESAVEHRAALELRLRFRAANGAWRWFKTSALPVESSAQTVVWIGMNTDVNAHRSASRNCVSSTIT